MMIAKAFTQGTTMSKHKPSLATCALAAACAIAAYQGAGLAMQAHEFLVDAYRIHAAWLVGSASTALLCAGVWALAGWRGGLRAVLLSALAMLLVVVIGLWHMGGSLRQALFQASCAPGAAICFNQAAIVMHLCLAIVLGCLVLATWRRYFPRMQPDTLR